MARSRRRQCASTVTDDVNVSYIYIRPPHETCDASRDDDDDDDDDDGAHASWVRWRLRDGATDAQGGDRSAVRDDDDGAAWGDGRGARRWG